MTIWFFGFFASVSPMFTVIAFRFLRFIVGVITLLSFLSPTAMAQVHPSETPDCRLDSEGRIITRLRGEPAERNSAQCAATCLKSSANLADPNRCTGYNFTWTIFAVQTGYETPYADSPRACQLLYGPVTFGKAWRVPYTTSCIMPCNSPPRPCGVFEWIAPPPGTYQMPDPPTRYLGPDSSSAKQPFEKPPR